MVQVVKFLNGFVQGTPIKVSAPKPSAPAGDSTPQEDRASLNNLAPLNNLASFDTNSQQPLATQPAQDPFDFSGIRPHPSSISESGQSHPDRSVNAMSDTDRNSSPHGQTLTQFSQGSTPAQMEGISGVAQTYSHVQNAQIVQAVPNNQVTPSKEQSTASDSKKKYGLAMAVFGIVIAATSIGISIYQVLNNSNNSAKPNIKMFESGKDTIIVNTK